MHLKTGIIVLFILVCLGIAVAHDDVERQPRNCWLDNLGNWWKFETDIRSGRAISGMGHRHDVQFSKNSRCFIRYFHTVGGLKVDSTGGAATKDMYKQGCTRDQELDLNLDYRVDPPIIEGTVRDTFGERPIVLTVIDCGQHP